MINDDFNTDFKKELKDLQFKQKIVSIVVNVGMLLFMIFTIYYIVTNRKEPDPPFISDHPITPEKPASTRSSNFDSIADAMKD